MTDDFDVAIIGYGPVGATLANLLARQSLRVLVLDQFDRAYTLPRATHLDGEAVRILQSAGLGEMLVSHLGVYPRMRFEDANGALLIDWPRSTLPGSHGWRDSNRFHQPELEIAPVSYTHQMCIRDRPSAFCRVRISFTGFRRKLGKKFS